MTSRAFDPRHSRTLALVGHRSSGKTTLGDALLHAGGVVRRPGRVDDGTSLLDHTPWERRRRMSLEPAFAWLPWRGHDVQIVDTPGNEELACRRDAILDAVDAAIVVVHGVDGVELGTGRALEAVARRGLPRMVVVTRAERIADPEGMIAAVRGAVGVPVVALSFPFRDHEGALAGIVDLCAATARRYADDGSGACSPEPLPAALAARIAPLREQLVEAVALTDDALLTEYLEYLELSEARLHEGLRAAVIGGRIVPVAFVSGLAGVGLDRLLDHAVDLFPAPEEAPSPLVDAGGAPVPIAADGPFAIHHVWTTVDDDGRDLHVLRYRCGAPTRGPWRVPGRPGEVRVNKLYRLRGPRRALAHRPGLGDLVAVRSPLPSRPGEILTDGTVVRLAPRPRQAAWAGRRVSGGTGSLDAALGDLVRRDPALEVGADPLTGDAVVRGTSELHVALAIEALSDAVPDLKVSPTPVAYRETVVGASPEAEGICTGVEDDGVETLGRVLLRLEPARPGAPVEVAWAAPEADLPERWRGPVEAGVRDALAAGPTAGYPVVGVRVAVLGGQYNAIWSQDAHLREAAARAVAAALGRGGTTLLEPWSRVEIEVPVEAVGGIVASLGAHRGRVLEVAPRGGRSCLVATVPEAEVSALRRRILSITAGAGRCTASPDRLHPLPASLVGDVVSASPVRRRRRAGAPAGLPEPALSDAR